MRADRLISLVMLLQARGRMTARELAAELECSERTIYRDVDALSAAGVPIYGDAGPDGGFRLLDDYRTELTGLTASELRALFMLTVPAPIAELGMAGDLHAALLKLGAASSARGSEEEERMRQRFYLDARPWAGAQEPLPHLRTVQQAAWQDRRACFTYMLAAGIKVEYVVDVLGLVARDGDWYVIHRRAGRVAVLPVRQLLDVALLDETYTRPRGFDLRATWAEWCEARESRRRDYEVVARVAPHSVEALSRLLGPSVMRGWGTAERGWPTVRLRFDSLEVARDRLLALGGALEVLAPEPLRRSIADYAEQALRLYSGR